MRYLIAALLLAALLPIAWAAATASKILVIHDLTFEKSSYSTFFTSLESKGYQIIYRSTKENSPILVSYDEKSFDNVFLFAPTSKSLPADVSPQKLVEFLKDDGNVLIALSSELSELYRDFAREFDLEFEERGTHLIDHFASGQKDASHSTVLIPTSPSNLISYNGIFPASASDQELPFLFKGVAHRLGVNPLAFPILKPSSTSYSFEVPADETTLEKMDNPDREVLMGSHPDASLISAFQLLDTDRRESSTNSPKRSGSKGRIVWCGSMAVFSDDFINAKSVSSRNGKQYAGTSNKQILTTLISWLTQSHGVLRVESTSHERVKMYEGDNRETYEEYQIEEDGQQRHIQKMYRIMDTVTYHIDVSQHTPNGWTPAPTDLDLQVSLVMLDPYITTNLTASSPQSAIGNLNASTGITPIFTRYSTTFKLPDKHGVYTFVVDWKRHGWSYIHSRDTVPVRPFNHDEHPRGLHSAWPYVTGASTTIIAFLLFVVIWVCSEEMEESKRQKKAL